MFEDLWGASIPTIAATHMQTKETYKVHHISLSLCSNIRLAWSLYQGRQHQPVVEAQREPLGPSCQEP